MVQGNRNRRPIIELTRPTIDTKDNFVKPTVPIVGIKDGVVRPPQSQELFTSIYLPYVVGPIAEDARFDAAIDGREHRLACIDTSCDT